MQFSSYSGHIGEEAPSQVGSKYGSVMLKPRQRVKKRMNVVAIAGNVIFPWIVFCLVAAMLSFEMHYKKANLCQTFLIIASVVLGLALLLDVAYLLWKRSTGEADISNGSWLLFLCVSCILALCMGIIVGNQNFWQNSETFYDVTALNAYTNVDPTRMRGQEIMDAGRVLFVKDAHLDTSRSMGFKNMDTYCVAPITVSNNGTSNPPLPYYDFWAIGTNCCSGKAEGGDFKCSHWDDRHARGGIRLIRDDQRPFYRLAVQQAESAHSIKAVHPLFFHWVADPIEETLDYQREAFKDYLVAMFIYFGFQMIQVYAAVTCFSMFASGP